MQGFVGLARVETMLRDINKMRSMIHQWAPHEELEKHWDEKVERWMHCIAPNKEEKEE